MAAPDQARALEAMKAVQSLPPQVLDVRITQEIGDGVLGVFRALARAQNPRGSDDDIAQRVHLMVLAWIMRGMV